jgi:small subunit ribosomal protein S6
MAREYELVLMLDPEAPDNRRDEIATGARQRIESSGELKHADDWGVRKMAYEIQQRNEADYRFFRFEQGAGVLEDLDHNLKITDGILRFRVYKVDARAPVIDPPPPLNLMAGSDRPGGRPRRDGGDDRPPRGPEPAAETSAPAPAEEPAAAPAEQPAE